MNETWQQIGDLARGGINTASWMGPQQLAIIDGMQLPSGWESMLEPVMAFAILVIGYVVALIAKALTKQLLHYLELDNRLVTWISGRRGGSEPIPIEEWISTGVFWLIFIFAIVAFLDKLKLTAASQPLNLLLQQVTSFFPKLVGAGALLGLAWILATVTQMLVVRILRTAGVDQKLQQQVGNSPLGNTPLSLSETLGNALYWFIFLLFLPSVLSTLELQGTLQPIQQMLNQILVVLPNILAAVLIGATGWLIAQIIRRIVTNLLAATGTDRIGTQLGLSTGAGHQTLSAILGTIVYILILIPTAIAALNALKIDAISGPAVSMLTQILNTIPQIFTAGLILTLAYFIGRFVADLVTNLLTGFGFNNVFSLLGFSHAWQTTKAQVYSDAEPEKTVLQSTQKTPSELVGIIALVGIMLFATVTAADVLRLPALTSLLQQLLALSGHVLFGLAVFAIGLYFANLAFNLIDSSGSRQGHILAHTARISILVLVSAMALQQMGIAGNIVNLAFGLLLGAIAVALGLAFGLGGRDIASQEINSWLSNFRGDKTPKS